MNEQRKRVQMQLIVSVDGHEYTLRRSLDRWVLPFNSEYVVMFSRSGYKWQGWKRWAQEPLALGDTLEDTIRQAHRRFVAAN